MVVMFIAWTISCLECVIHSWTNKHMLDWMMIDWDICDHNCDSISDSYLFLVIYHSKCSSSSSSSRCLAIHSLFLDDWYRGTLPNLGKASLFLDEWVLLHPYFCVLHLITWMYSYFVEKMLSRLPINIWKNPTKKTHTPWDTILYLFCGTHKKLGSQGRCCFPKYIDCEI